MADSGDRPKLILVGGETTSRDPQGGSQAEGSGLDSSRRSAQQILNDAADSGRDELERSSHALAISGLAGGLTMGLTGMAVAMAQSILGEGHWQQFVAMLFYPAGFIAVIIGRAQLFTENTLYPVVLVLTERKHLLNTLRLWSVVFVSNVIGALCFAFLAVKTGALQPLHVAHLVKLGLDTVGSSATQVFWSAVLGGWLIALVAWMVTASHWTIGQIAVIWLLTFIVGIGHFAHCVASSGEILSAMFHGDVPVISYLRWLGLATSGNVLGGVVMVTLLNWGQVTAGKADRGTV